MVAFWVRLNLDATDTLIYNDPNSIYPINYLFPNPYGASSYGYTKALNVEVDGGNVFNSPARRGEWFLMLLDITGYQNNPTPPIFIDAIINAFQPTATNTSRTSTVDFLLVFVAVGWNALIIA